MSRSAQLTTVARAEAISAAHWLARRSPQAARDFRKSLSDAARLLGHRPLAGRQQVELIGPHFRLWSLVSFPYVLVYDPRPEPPQILRIAHTARDLGPLLGDLSGLSDDQN